MLNLLMMLDVAATPMILFFVLAIVGLIIVVGLIVLSIILIVKAIKKKKHKPEDINKEK